MRRKSFWVGMIAAGLWIGIDRAPAQQVNRTQLAGGSGGREFTDSPPSPDARILEIQVRAGDTIDAIQVVYVTPDGRSVPGPRRGGRGGDPYVFRLDSDEFIIGISGRYGDTVDSLRLHTSKRTSPVYGGRGGDRDFRLEVPAGSQFSGFTGRSGDTIDAIGLAFISGLGMNRRGVFTRQIPPEQGVSSLRIMNTEISGGRGGRPFADRDVPAGARLIEIRIGAGDAIDSVQAVYLLPDGRVVEGARHGGRGGRLNTLRLDSDEYVIGLSGRFGDTVDSLRIHTNKRVSQQFGGNGGDHDFRIEVPGRNQAVGFTGRSGDLVDAIGLTYTESSMNSPWRRSRP